MKKNTIYAFMFIGLFSCKNNDYKSTQDDLLANSVVPFDKNDIITEKFKKELKTILKDVTVLALGEATHEDGLTLKYKTELVKFLHKELGYNVIAFEYGFYGNWLTNKKLNTGMPAFEATKYSGWAKSKYAYPIYEYISKTKQTNNPLNYIGYDGEKVPDGIGNITQMVDSIIAASRFKISNNDRTTVDSLINVIYSRIGHPIKKAFKYKRKTYALNIIKNLKKHILSNKDALVETWGQHEYNIYNLTLNSLEMDLDVENAGNFWNIIRDHNMGKRVGWIKDSIYPNEKIILWGASGHFSRNQIKINRKEGNEPYYQAGDWLHEYYGDKFYALSFTTASGKVGTVYPDNHMFKKYESLRDIDNKDTNSFEGVAYSTEKKTLFCDLRNLTKNSWLDKSFISYSLGYNVDFAPWKEVHDGIFFIREMQPDVWRSNN